MNKKLSIVLAIVAVVAIVFSVVFGVQKADLEKQVAELTAKIDTLNAELTTVKADLAAAKSEAEKAEADRLATEEALKSLETYTVNYALSTFPTLWNIHDYETATDAEIADWITAGFYSFDYNETFDGYKMVPAVAAEFPVDVTADYVGEQWGIKEGDTARAWKIQLRQDLKWQDGTAITAHDFEESYKLLINPKAANYRADGLWSGNMVITNSEAYYKAGQEADTMMGTYMGLEGTEDAAAFVEAHKDDKGYINWNYSFGDTYDFETKAWTGAAEDAIVETPLTFGELYEFYTKGEGKAYATWASEADMIDWALEELYLKYTYAEMAWENVGVKALDDYNLVFIIDKPLEGFYLHYSLTSNYLVNLDMYNACATETDGVYTNTYGTKAENTMSYGPYMLTNFQSDKMFTLEKNPYWYGWNDEANKGLYQATTIRYDYVAEPSTRLEMFLNGQLDSYGLQKEDMEEYAMSDYTYYSEGDSIFAMVFNPEMAALTTAQQNAGENKNKTILTVKEFRMAMAMAMNRAEFCLATSPTNKPGFALYSSQIIADPENGIPYRATDLAKQVIVDFWALSDEIGEGKMYATVDEAIESISGYNLEMARVYFDQAYEIAIKDGLMDEDDVIEITVGTPNLTSSFYNNGYDYIVNNYTEAVKGTKLEGKLTFTRDGTLGNAFSDALQNNQVDMLFGVGWTGSTFDPYGLFQVYVDPNYQYDSHWDATAVTLDIELNGTVYTATARAWYDSMQGTGTEIDATANGEEVKVSLDGTEQKMIVLAALENAVLQNYNYIPLMGDSSASLKGMQIKFFTEDEVFPMGRGGVKYMTFNYTDREWDEYVASQGGTLNYK
ncbi:MAG: hypothetical protein E7329_00315 [Clostridiales bacterium]|nr:hypothetical protein [Clostridiales bacterium]